MNDYSNLKPQEVFRWFNEISMIPRCSGNEEQVSDFLVEFAKERELEVYQDQEFNVIIKKEASPGYEGAPIVILQGHMDMVCDKSESSQHDFRVDPILWKQEGDYLYAQETTLGGDDGIAVAFCLALLDDESLKHPALEVLITTNEETGMDGANAVDGSLLDGEILINIDAEDEGVFLASCSGGANSFVAFDKEWEALEAPTMKLEIGGLLGGHSGMEIHKERGNSIKLMGRILDDLSQAYDFRLADLQGGSEHNAIAINASCLLVVEEEDQAGLRARLEEFIQLLKAEYRVADPGLSISLSEGEPVAEVYSRDLTSRLIDFMMLVPYGVEKMSLEIEGLVESSSNVGVILDSEEALTFMSCVRSSVTSELHAQLRFIDIVAKNLGAKAWVEKEYPGWVYAEESYIRDLATEVYEDLFGQKPLISAAHCGLETGILNAIKPGLDMLSIGPDLADVHTFNENLYLPSVDKVWSLLIHLLERVK